VVKMLIFGLLLYFTQMILLFGLGGYEYDSFHISRRRCVVIGGVIGFGFALLSTVAALLYS